MNKGIEILTYKNRTLKESWEVSEPNNVYEKTYVDLALKYNLIDLPIEYFQNNLKGLKLRRSFKLTDEQKELVLNHPSLTDDEKFVLELTDFNGLKERSYTFEGKASIDGFVNILKDASMDVLEDLLNVFEELEADIRKENINVLTIRFYIEE